MDLKKQNEEVEELDELSKSTLGSYVKKAIRDKSDVAYEKGYWDRADHKDKPEKRLVRDKISDRKSWRDAGIKKAINRLTKEDVESITEGKMDKMTLSGLWHRHAQHSYMSDQGYGHGEGGMKNNEHAATAIENHVRKHYGNKVADDMVSHSDHHVSHAEYAGPESSSHHEKEADKLRKKHGIHGDLYGESVEHVNERTLTSGETSEKERIVHGMKKSLKGFKARYGDRAKEVIYATATKQAKKD